LVTCPEVICKYFVVQLIRMADTGTGIEAWWRDLPIVTKWLFALSFGVTLAANFGVLDSIHLTLNFSDVFQQFEIWRLLTAFLFHGRLGFPFLIHMIFLVRYGQSLEQTMFSGRTADFLFFLGFGSTILLVAAYFLNLKILGMSLIMMIIYLWSRKNPNVVMSFMFGIRFQAFYFPWVLVGFDVLMGGFPKAEIVGIIVGHIYFFLEDIYPATGGPRLLKTPQFLYNWFPSPYQRVQANNNQRHTWGTGRPLGGTQ